MATMKRTDFKRIRNAAFVVVFYALLMLLSRFKVINPYVMQLVQLACINLMMTLSLQVINGYTGQFSIGQAGFMAIGAYGSSYLTTALLPAAAIPSRTLQLLYFALALLFGGALAGLTGFLIGLPCLKLRGDYLAIVTLAFGEIIRAIIRMIPAIGGPRGFTSIPSYTTFTIIFIVTVGFILFVRNFSNSPQGRACISIRENEIAADTLGINTFRFKMLAFVVSSCMAGIAGGLFAHLYSFIQPDQFSLTKSCDYLVFLYAGGTASISGSLISAVLLTILPETLRFLSTWRIVIYAVLLVFIMLKRPNGLYGGREFPALRVRNYDLGVAERKQV